MSLKNRRQEKRTVLKIIEQTVLPRLLLYLLEVEKAHRSMLKEELKASQDTIYKALRLASESGLIEDFRESGFGGKVETVLSVKGRLVAEKLVEIRDILEKG